MLTSSLEDHRERLIAAAEWIEDHYAEDVGAVQCAYDLRLMAASLAALIGDEDAAEGKP